MCHLGADLFAGKLIISLQMLLRMVPASVCWFCVEEERGNWWEGLGERWWIAAEMGPSLHSSYCRYRNWLCLYSNKGDFCPVWDSLSPTCINFAVKTHGAFCCARNASDFLCGAISVAKSTGQPGENQCRLCPKDRNLVCATQSWTKCLEPWRNHLVTVSASAFGSSVLHLQSCIYKMYFPGLLHIASLPGPSVKYAELSLTLLVSNLRVFSPWKGEASFRSCLLETLYLKHQLCPALAGVSPSDVNITKYFYIESKLTT